MAACDVVGKKPIEDLCSTDSGTSYTSSTSGVSEKRPLPESDFDPRQTNLNFFHDFANIESVISGSFTKVKQLSSCCRGEGSIELHRFTSASSTEEVVVKKLPLRRVNVNKGKVASEQALLFRHASRDSEDPLAEIGVFGYLRQCEQVPEYILEMRQAFFAQEDVWLVLEHADGGDLFGMISSHHPSKDLIWLWSWQLLQAVAFLHKQQICHRDISLENILLSKGDIRLMDFGQAVRSQSSSGQLLRYFLATGKPYYRPPETYIPGSQRLQVMVPPGLSPGQVALAYTPGQEFLCHVRLLDVEASVAEPYGYTAPAVDIFATAVSVLIMFFAAPPWKQARPTDSYFQWVQSNGLLALAKSWKKPLPLPMTDLLGRMLRSNAEHRPAAEECLAHSCFATLRSAPVALRTAGDLLGLAPGAEAVPRLAGDCYREPEWVCRSAGPGMAMDSAAGGEWDLMLGDPYHEPQGMELMNGECEEWQQLLCEAPPPLTLLREDRTEIKELDAAFLASREGG